MPPTLVSLRRRALRNDLEVEHVLQAAALRIEGLPGLLDELSLALGWSDTGDLPDGSRVVPLARWGRVASAYCRQGADGLRQVLREPGHETFVVSLLEEVRTPEAVDAILELFSACVLAPSGNPALARRIASSLNLMLCFKPEVKISALVQGRIRSFAVKTAAEGVEQVDRAVPVLLLRAVGDESSLAFLATLPDFSDSWSDTIPSTRKAIKKRLARQEKT